MAKTYEASPPRKSLKDKSKKIYHARIGYLSVAKAKEVKDIYIKG